LAVEVTLHGCDEGSVLVVPCGLEPVRVHIDRQGRAVLRQQL
jgi:hypothetical protein